MNLKKYRKKQNLTQEKVAKTLGITTQAYANYEQGRREASYQILINLSNLLKVSIDELLDNNSNSIKRLENNNIPLNLKSVRLSTTLKALRKKKNLNQRDLAKYLNISQPGYAKYENDLAEPNLETLKQLSDLYKVSIDELIGNPIPVATTNLEITLEKAKEIWFSQLEPEDRETINYYFMLSIPDRLKVQGYILGRLNQVNV